MISYAGVQIDCPTQAQIAEIRSRIDPSWLWTESAHRTSPGSSIGLMNSFRGYIPPGPVRVGTLSWPVGAARFAHGHFLVSQAQLDAIRTSVQAGGYHAAPFVLNDGRSSVVTSLWMLPARPVDQVPGCGGLYLLSLVDDRWRWWWSKATVTVSQAVPSPTSLPTTVFAAIGGITASVFVVGGPALDGGPNPWYPGMVDLSGTHEALPLLLDAWAETYQCRWVRFLDGTVTNANPATSVALRSLNLAQPWMKTAGGLLSLG